jgi:uncharacterized protein (DUF2267 family)
MSATGLDTFDKTLQTTHVWLDDICEELGPDKQVAWHALGAVLRAIRDRIPVELAAHLGAELPILVRGTYYDQYKPEAQPEAFRSRAEFLEHVEKGLAGARPTNPETATRAVLETLARHVPHGQLEKVRHALPEEVRAIWHLDRAA